MNAQKRKKIFQQSRGAAEQEFSMEYFSNKKSISARGFSLFLILAMVCVLFGGLYTGVNAAGGTIQYNGTSTAIQVDGASQVTDNRYTFTNTLTITISAPPSTAFNRYTLVYSSDSHLRGTIYYTQGSSSYHEDFFLEPGVNTTFSSLTDGYLSSLTGTKISKIELHLIKTSSATFQLFQINTAKWDVQKNSTVYIENTRYKLGVHLLWGGGLSYLEDKQDGDSTITNMLNEHDTGRLVQQSYYGTSSAPYVPAQYSGSTWPYNPVQGGDQYGNKSKLVDFEIKSNSIYVKCRPLDWAQRNMYTFTYMENTYTLESNYILVDNRFIDFSTYNHGGARDQELPAFYTISYLNTFTYYAGTKPWTGDALTEKKNLPFWGGNSDCRFELARGNTETWCAWVSSDKGYGIGLYTPGVSTLYAGRHNPNDSKSASNDGTNYVAPLIKMSMKNCEAFEYSYLITTGTVNTIRSVFQNNRDKAVMDKTSKITSIDFANLTFDRADELDAFTSTNSCQIVHEPGVAKFTVNGSGSDPYAYIDYARSPKVLYTNQYNYIIFTYMVPKTNKSSSYTTELFICTGNRIAPEGGYSITFKPVCDGNYHTQTIDLSKYPDLWQKTAAPINGIRVDFFSDASVGDVFYLSELSLKATLNTSTASPTASPTNTPKPSNPTPTPTPGQTTTGQSPSGSPTAGQDPTGQNTAEPTTAPDTELPETTNPADTGAPVTDTPDGADNSTDPAKETDTESQNTAAPGETDNGSAPAPATATAAPGTKNKGGLSAGMIALIISIAVIVCAGIAALILFLVKRRKTGPEDGNGTV